LKTLARFLKVTLVGGLLAVLPLGAQALLPKRRSQPKSDTFWTESVIAMKTVKSSDEKFTATAESRWTRLAILAGIQTLLQKVMQSGWLVQKQ